MIDATDYEKRVLAAVPAKALTFLRAIATKVEIRALLFGAGYTQAEQEQGWTWLHVVTGYVPPSGTPADDAAARAAIAELDEWDEPGLRRIGAALQRLHPAQYEFVFAGLDSAQGVGAVLSVSTLLQRLDALENGADRTSTREADRAAIATLTARGITPELRAHLGSLVSVAQGVATPDLSDPAADQRDEALLNLLAWYKDWSETARAVVHRKDYLIMLGLSKRRQSKGNDDVEDVPATEVPLAIDDQRQVQSNEPAVATA